MLLFVLFRASPSALVLRSCSFEVVVVSHAVAAFPAGRFDRLARSAQALAFSRTCLRRPCFHPVRAARSLPSQLQRWSCSLHSSAWPTPTLELAWPFGLVHCGRQLQRCGWFCGLGLLSLGGQLQRCGWLCRWGRDPQGAQLQRCGWSWAPCGLFWGFWWFRRLLLVGLLFGFGPCRLRGPLSL